MGLLCPKLHKATLEALEGAVGGEEEGAQRRRPKSGPMSSPVEVAGGGIPPPNSQSCGKAAMHKRTECRVGLLEDVKQKARICEPQ